MKTTMWKLHNSVKHYDWGSIDMISKLFHINNPHNNPMAEVWMGTHSSGVSIANDANANCTPLDQLVAINPTKILGEDTAQQYHSLPYLFKILSADSPLSIQVHPNRSKAILGYEKENKVNIPIDSPRRNYKDPNHKPELVYAITPFLAMNAFRPIKDIISLFSQLNINELSYEVEQLANNPDSKQLKKLFYFILTLNGEQKNRAISQLINKTSTLTGFVFDVIKEIIKKYPSDIGVFAPLILNVVELKPGQAMFLQAQTPHAYLKGTALEIMANSDNVLRAGLTSKFIDIDELFANTNFDSISPTELLTRPVIDQNRINFPVPVKDFAFDIIHCDVKQITQEISSAQIILCLEGQISLSTSTDNYTIKVGESVFIAEHAKTFSYKGKGIIARAFNQ